MNEIIDQQLPEDFYEAKAWFGSLIEFYSEGKQKKFDRAILEMPLTHLTFAIETIIFAYGNSSHVMVDAFEKVVNPLYAPGEYKEGVYDILKKAAIERRDARLDGYAESLMYIRGMFERDMEFLKIHFNKEISKIPGEEEISVKAGKFSEILSLITRTHIRQVIKMIKESCKVSASGS